MIQKMRIRFVILTMTALLAVLLLILGGINIANYSSIASDADRLLYDLSDIQGPAIRTGPDSKPRKTSFTHLVPEQNHYDRFFYVVLGSDGAVLEVRVPTNPSINTDAASTLGTQAFSGKNSTGFLGIYRFLKQSEGDSTRILFLDCGRELESFRRFLLASILLSGAGSLLVLAVVVYFSGRIVRPFAQTYEKQKRFITDAGHEIKTPLTVLQADTDILEMELGSNEWLTDMRGQLKHLSSLTNDLVSLARMEEGESSLSLLEIPISDVVYEAAESFRTLARSQGKELDLSVEPMLSMVADEKSVRQLVGILLDNALKYSPENSKISLNLSRQPRQIRLSVANPSSVPLPEDNADILFERFYRVDTSRNSQTGGHGIGLSIAKAIVTAHGGKIRAAVADGTGLQITTLFPQKN